MQLIIGDACRVCGLSVETNKRAARRTARGSLARHVHVLMFVRRPAHQIWRFDSIRVAIERKDVKEMLGLAAHYAFMLTFVSPLTLIG